MFPSTFFRLVFEDTLIARFQLVTKRIWGVLKCKSWPLEHGLKQSVTAGNKQIRRAWWISIFHQNAFVHNKNNHWCLKSKKDLYQTSAQKHLQSLPKHPPFAKKWPSNSGSRSIPMVVKIPFKVTSLNMLRISEGTDRQFTTIYIGNLKTFFWFV